MTERRWEEDSNGAAAEVAVLNTVFVDTSLDTHLALLVHRSDTISDFKKKVALEHLQCFPEIGEIEVHSVKVKRRSNFYHMPDIMLVWSAFARVKRNWFLSVDASSIQTSRAIRDSLEHDTRNGVKSGLVIIDDDVIGLTSDANKNEILPLAMPDDASEKNVVSEMIAKPAKKTTNSHRSIYLEEHNLGTESRAKKKRKIRHTKDGCDNASMGAVGDMFNVDGKDGKTTMPDSIVNLSGLKNDQNDGEGVHVSEGTTPPTMADKNNLGSTMDSQNPNGSDRRNEGNMFKSMVDYGLGQDSPTQQLGVVSGMVPDSSAKLMDVSGVDDVNTASTKRKKKKVPKTAAKIHEFENMELTGEGERIKPSTDTHNFEILAERKGLPLDHDREAIMPSNSKARGQVDPTLALKEESVLQDAEKSNISIVISQKLLDSNRKKEHNVLESTMDYDLDKNVPTVHLGGVFAKTPNLSGRLDTSGGTGNVNIDEKTRKKKKVPKTAAKIRDLEHIELIGEGERIKPSTDTHNFEELVEGKSFPFDLDCEAIMPSNSKSPGQVDPTLALKEESVLQEAEKSNNSIVISQKLLDSNRKKEDDVLESTMDYDLDQDVPAAHLGGVFAETPNLSARLDSSGGTGNVNIDGKKRKKKKVHKIVAEVQDTRVVDYIGKCEMKKPHAETIGSEKKEEEKGLSSEHDNEVTPPSDSKASDHVVPDLALKEARVMQDAEVGKEPEISSSIKKSKKKKRVKKSDGTSIQNSGITEVHNGISGSLGLPSPSSDHIPKETEKEESIGHDEGNDFQMKIFDGFNHDAQAKVSDANKIEADLEVKMQKQRSEDASIINNKMVEKTNTSAYADFNTAQTENTIMASNQADKDKGNTANRNEKATRKRKKRKHTVTDVQENLPNKDQQDGIKPLTTKETSFGSKSSEHEVRHADSSQVLSGRTEVKVDEMHELVLNTDDLAENPGNGTEGINFKQYVVSDQLQDKFDSADNLRKGTKSQRCSKKAKDNELTSLNISAEQQNSIKSSENKEAGNISYREDSGRTKFDSTQNSDLDETSPDSFKRSSEAPEKERSSTLQKPNGIVTASSVENKNRSLGKLSSGRSNTLHSISGNERPLLGLNVTKMSMMKTPKKKILFAKSGAVFQDNSGESSGDEMHSNFSTLSPSDSSSMSGDSAGESELSQNSINQGSSDAEGKCTGGKNTSKLDSASSPKDLTMDLILRSSKRFKKARQSKWPLRPKACQLNVFLMLSPYNHHLSVFYIVPLQGFCCFAQSPFFRKGHLPVFGR